MEDDAGEMEGEFWVRLLCAHEIKVIVSHFHSSAIGLALCTRDE